MTAPTFTPYSSVIINITNANPAVVTTLGNNGFLDGSYVTLFIPYNSMPLLNQQTFLATIINPTRFSIPIDTTNMDAFVLHPLQDAQVIPAGEIAATLKNAVRNQS